MESIKKELYKSIDLYGLNDLKTIQLSQKLDEVIVKKMKIWVRNLEEWNKTSQDKNIAKEVNI